MKPSRGHRFIDDHDETLMCLNLLPGWVDEALEASAATLNYGDGKTALTVANNVLASARVELGEEWWRESIIPLARSHRFAELVWLCPITRRSFDRPRGYPGDAVLLDLIYGHPAAAHLTSSLDEIGRIAHAFTSDVPACHAVRARRLLLGRAIDAAAAASGRARVLSVACGHLRELECSTAFEEGRIEMRAIDQDDASLAVAASYASVETARITVRRLLRSDHGLQGFDLAYAAGLYDYLDQRTAALLTRTLFSMLAPGGRLIVPNFLQSVWEAPYLDAFMDWSLIYRSQAEITSFASMIRPADIAQHTFYADDLGYIGYLDLVRA